MRVYGDRARCGRVGSTLEALVERSAAVRAMPPGLARHGRLVGLLIDAAALHQGIADLELARHGADEDTIAQRAGLDVLTSLARRVASSWDDPVAPRGLDISEAAARWRAAAPDDRVSLRLAEGFAHYAVYPEAYLEAARTAAWSAPVYVIGLRSIGTALAPMVAALAQRPMIATLRPTGEPFDRRLALGERLRARMLAHGGRYAVVDEGPGLSGSSFGAVGDFLEEAGVAPERITYLPSHGAAPGPMASRGHRDRWGRTHRLVADFDTRVGIHRLAAWASQTLGEVQGPLRDLSGGAWRSVVGSDAPATPALERRKFLAETTTGTWLLKFAGLGGEGEAKTARGRALSAAGFSPEIGGLAHGFLASRWRADARPLQPGRHDRARLLDHLERYLAFRAERFPASDEDGAGLAALADMACINAAEGVEASVGAALAQRLRALLIDPPPSRPVHVDGRLHAWDWLVTPRGEILKVDALDHSCGHDLVGCQDIAWDVAGAELELELSPAQTERLAERLGVAPRLLTIHRACYPAFQLGLWSLAPADEAPRVVRHVRRYREALRRFAGQTSGEDEWMEARRRAT